MKIRRLKTFDKAFLKLPEHLQTKTEKAVRLLLQDFHHPSLHTKDCGHYSFNTPSTPIGKVPECSSGGNTFRKTAINKGDTVGANIFSGGLGLFFGFNYKYSYFDAYTYEKAVDEALKNSNLDRRTLISEYDRYRGFLKDFANLRERYTDQYFENIKKVNLVSRINDKSGFYRDDINILGHIRITPNSIPNDDKFFIFSTKAQEIKAFLSPKPNNLSDYEKELKSATSSFRIGGPKTIKEKGYLITLNFPDQIENTGQDQRVPIDVIIESKDFGVVYPTFFAEDNAISLSFKDNKFSLSNKTSGYVQVKSISVYYGNLIHTTSFKDESAIELAPISSPREPLNIDGLVDSGIKKIATFNQINKVEAKQKNINFGFAVKYRLVDQNTDKTILVTKNFNLFDILVSKM